MSNMWYNKLIVAKQAKAARVNRNKARLVQRTIIRLWGKTAGNSWFSGSRWHKYIDDDVYADMPELEPLHQAPVEVAVQPQAQVQALPQPPVKKYADVLREQLAASMEAARRRERGVHYEMAVRHYVNQIWQYSANKDYLDGMTEAIARVRRNDPEFEEAVKYLTKW